MNPDQAIITLLTEFQWPAIFIGSFLFGETVIITAAFMAAEGLWTLSDVFWISLAGTVASDSTWFLFGQRILAFFKRPGSPKPRGERLLAAIEKITGTNRFALILCAKFIYGTRILTIMYLSMRKMNYFRFSAYDTLGSTLWLAVVCAIGWMAGRSIANLAPYMNTFEYAALFLILVIAVFKIGTVWISRKIVKE